MSGAGDMLELRPVTLAEARRFIGEHHRHNLPPITWRFGVGLTNGSPELVGVGMAGNPMAKALADGVTLEAVRVCTLGTPNACSMLYGALCRAAKALGYRSVITYTLPAEGGSSLKAAGFALEAVCTDTRGWDRPKRRRVQVDLFGEQRTPQVEKWRWRRWL